MNFDGSILFELPLLHQPICKEWKRSTMAMLGAT